MFYLLSSDKYFYCRETGDLLVVDPNHVKIGDTVPFTFGSKSYSGDVLAKSENEEDMLSEITKRSKEKVQIVKEGSLPPGKKVRKTAKAQMEKMKDMFPNIERKIKPMGKVPPKKSQKKVDYELKKAAEVAVGSVCFPTSDSEESHNSSGTTSSDSEASSLEALSAAQRAAAKRKDLKALQTADARSHGEADNGGVAKGGGGEAKDGGGEGKHGGGAEG